MSREPRPLADQISQLAALAEPLRKSLYFFVIGQEGEVSRDQSARAMNASRALVAFHLDKLVEAGLLEVTYRRTSGRRGPGAGRPSKLYRRSPQRIEVSLPERRYQLAAQLLLQAVANLPDAGVGSALRDVAHQWGQRLGVEARARANPNVTPERIYQEALEILGQCGFEPCRDAEGNLLLRNCPFEALATEHRDIVCQMNVALMEGLIVGLDLPDVAAKLDPQPGMCCVVLKLDPRKEMQPTD